jgi:hypothetical protein
VFGIYPHRYHPATIGAELKEAPSGFLSWLSIAALNVVVLPTALSATGPDIKPTAEPPTLGPAHPSAARTRLRPARSVFAPDCFSLNTRSALAAFKGAI